MRLLTIVRYRLKTGALATAVTLLYNYILHPIKFHEAGFSTHRMIKSAEIFHSAILSKLPSINIESGWFLQQDKLLVFEVVSPCPTVQQIASKMFKHCCCSKQQQPLCRTLMQSTRRLEGLALLKHN